MASSPISRGFAVIALAAAAAISYVTSTISAIGTYIASIAYSCIDAFKTEPPFRPVPVPQAEQSLGLVAAKAFLMRMAQRDRPRDTPLWRMCPTT